MSNLALPVGAIIFRLSRAAVCSGGSGGISPPIHSVDPFKTGRGTTKEIFLVSFPPNQKILCYVKIKLQDDVPLIVYVYMYGVFRLMFHPNNGFIVARLPKNVALLKHRVPPNAMVY